MSTTGTYTKPYGGEDGTPITVPIVHVFDIENPALGWIRLRDMQYGVNHAAAAFDGKLMHVFGGRDGGNTVTNGFDYHQIFDPVTGLWTTDLTSPLPVKRGGLGKAVYHNGKIYVFGGETGLAASTTNKISSKQVFYRNDVYDISTNKWTSGTDMLSGSVSTSADYRKGLHGMFPLWYKGSIYIAGGGIKRANSQSDGFYRLRYYGN